MTFPIKNAECHHKIHFNSRAMEPSLSHAASPAPSRFEDLLGGSEEPLPSQNLQHAIIEELPSDGPENSGEEFWEDEGEPDILASPFSLIPDLFTSFPPIIDSLTTATSKAQDNTTQEVLPFLTGSNDEFATYNRHGIPHLDRKRHIRFLHKSLGKLSSSFIAADASRPWYFYWALCALGALGEDVSSYREALISTVRPMQNATGGFGSGHLQMSHLAPTYAIVCSLAMVGGQEALELINRRAMWKWLGALKQRDGGFQMAIGGEEDVRYWRSTSSYQPFY
jgi:protein farnesyltransferase subunit beta